MRCAIVIPAYNHEATVAEVVRQSLALGYPVVVVDDGSTDSTYEQIRNIASVIILRHAQNRGKGAALLTGFAEATKNADWAATLDADGQHRPEDLPRLLAAVTEGRRPIVVGRREGMQAEHVPRASRFGRKFSNFWVQASGGPSVSDTQSGMRLYPLPETLKLPVRARRFQFEVEVLVKARWYGIPVVEAPIRVSYAPKGQRISHYRGFVDFMRNSAAFTRLIFGRFFFLPFIRFSKKSSR
jgi:glycosyltransferase involved in cell wall biosynthesis